MSVHVGLSWILTKAAFLFMRNRLDQQLRDAKALF